MKKYEKIAEWIRDEVEAGTLSLGDKLPPENELMTQFQVIRRRPDRGTGEKRAAKSQSGAVPGT